MINEISRVLTCYIENAVAAYDPCRRIVPAIIRRYVGHSVLREELSYLEACARVSKRSTDIVLSRAQLASQEAAYGQVVKL